MNKPYPLRLPLPLAGRLRRISNRYDVSASKVISNAISKARRNAVVVTINHENDHGENLGDKSSEPFKIYSFTLRSDETPDILRAWVDIYITDHENKPPRRNTISEQVQSEIDYLARCEKQTEEFKIEVLQ